MVRTRGNKEMLTKYRNIYVSKVYTKQEYILYKKEYFTDKEVYEYDTGYCKLKSNTRVYECVTTVIYLYCY